MARKKAGKKPQEDAPKIEASPAIVKVTSKEEAKTIVLERFPQSPSNVSYIVLENCNIFYGYNKAAALKYAKTFNLKHFEVTT